MSNKVKIGEIAKEAGRSWKDVISKAQELSIEVGEKQTVSEEEAGKIFEGLKNRNMEDKFYRNRGDNIERPNREPRENNGDRPYNRDYSRPPRENSDGTPYVRTPRENNGDRPYNRDYSRPPRENSDGTPYVRTPRENNGDRPYNRDYSRPPRENSDGTPYVRTPRENNGDRPYNRDYSRPPRENSDGTPYVRTPRENNGDRPYNRDFNRTPSTYSQPQQPATISAPVPIPNVIQTTTVLEVSEDKQKGLRIIKKRKPLIPVRDNINNNIIYGKLSESAKQELNLKRASAKKSSTTTSSTATTTRKKNSGEELNIFERALETRSNFYRGDDESEHEIVLLDYRDQSLFAEDPVEKTEAEIEAKKEKLKKLSAIKSPKKHRNQQELTKETRKKRKRVKVEEEVVSSSSVEVPENIRVYEFAEMTKKPLAEVIKVLFNLGVMVTKNDFLDSETIEILAQEFGIEVETVDMTEEFDYVKDYDDIEENSEDFVIRAPVITIMGHVDHGKTSLLDRIRSSKVALDEAGGITQHIGAYTIQHDGNPITFIDTPGHSAFSEMRKRGARITDIVVIVVAGDDGVKPQTREAIKHALDAKVPVIVAMNKMDKEGANPDMVRAQVAETGLTPIEWGGETEFIPVSAKTGEGIDTLLETILIQAEVLELSANPNRNAKAVVIESTLEKGRGPVATVIVQNGTLKIGDTVVVGEHYGKVKALLDYNKKSISQIAPGETGVVVGLSGIPASGEDLVVTDTESEARELADKRRIYERNVALSKTTKASLDELSSMIAEGKLKVLKIILKTDVHGTLEAIRHSLETLKNEEVKVMIISEGVGGITENDVVMASDSDNIMIIGFNVRPTGVVKNLAEKNNVKLKTYTIIYEILDDVINILTGMMKPIEEEKHTGQAEVKQIFKVRDGIVAGCIVADGTIQKGILARVIRHGVVIGNTNVASLKRFKDEVMEVKRGFECGILLKDFQNLSEGDIIETYEKVTRQAKF